MGYTGYDYTGTKSIPDVSYNADPYTGVAVYETLPGATSGGWQVFGGTSAGAPQWAAMTARCNWNQISTNPVGSDTYGGVNMVNDVYSMYFMGTKDIVSGSNGIYNAVKWYDLSTGMGSPKGQIMGQNWGIPSADNFLW